MAERVRSMIVHDVFVTWEGRQDKAEKFIPPIRARSSALVTPRVDSNCVIPSEAGGLRIFLDARLVHCATQDPIQSVNK
jgi:hypothetical protein